MDAGTWWAAVHGVAKSRATTERLTLNTLELFRKVIHLDFGVKGELTHLIHPFFGKSSILQFFLSSSN